MKITVDLCLTHYGHQQDLQHTWLPKQKKEEMAALLQQGVFTNKILGDIREKGMQGEAFKRYHLTDMKDLSNISRAFGLGEVQRFENDQESVRARIQEWQESENNSVLFYKFQGEQAPEDLHLLQEDFSQSSRPPSRRQWPKSSLPKVSVLTRRTGLQGIAGFHMTSLNFKLQKC